MTQVFISYAHEDVNVATKLYDELKSIPGIEPWLDKKSLLPGMRWKPAIRKAIRESRFFIALLSNHSVAKKGYFQKELNDALDILTEFPEDKIFLIPVRLEPCEPPSEKLRDIQFVDFFPDWNEGLERVLKTIRARTDIRKDFRKTESKPSTGYEYRCGIVDLDTGLPNIPKIVTKLNDIQHFFLFTCPKISLDTDYAVQKIKGYQNLIIDRLPTSLYEQMQYLNVDFAVCLTKYPLAFRHGKFIKFNYFSRPSAIDERFMFISTHLLYEFVKQTKCTFEKGIAYIIIGQLLVYFTDFGYHLETKECVMDFCKKRLDMVKGLKRMRLCDDCSARIKNPDLKEAITTILADELKI